MDESNQKESGDDQNPPINTALENFYQDTGYNRNSTLIAQYVNRILPDFPTPTERYYDIRLMPAAGRKSYFGETGDQCIMFHSNRICVIALSPTHPVIAEDKIIDRIEFTFDGHEKIDRLASEPRGKSKKGSQKLHKSAPICAIKTSDGHNYIITAGLGAKLIEINQNIKDNPDLIKRRPLSSGFIAMIQPNDWKRMDEVKQSLPKLGQHEKYLQDLALASETEASLKSDLAQ